MRYGFKIVAMAIVAVSAALSITAAIPSSHVTPNGSASRLQTSATTDDISVAGYDPTTVALSWQESGDWCFTSYEIQYSTSGSSGPWTTYDTITSQGVTSMLSEGWSPGETAWFEDIDNSACGGGSATSNVVSVTFPSEASLSYVDSAASTVQLSWENNANYGGLLSFVSYQVQEQINGAGFSTIDTLTSASSTSYSVVGVTGLNTGTDYQFKVVTTDDCNDCSGGSYPTAMSSNTVTQLAIAQPNASPDSIQVGQTTKLSVQITGGNSPYTYDWSGLPAGCSPANSDPLTCTPTSAGTYSVTVTVTDSRGISVTSLTLTVTVTSSSGGGLLGGGSSGTSGAWSNPLVWVAVAVIVLLALLILVLLLRGRRDRQQGTSESSPGTRQPSSQTQDPSQPAGQPQASALTGGYCKACGQSSRQGAAFCRQCGSPLTPPGS